MDRHMIVIFLMLGCIAGRYSEEAAHTEVPPTDPATSTSPHVSDHHDEHETSTLQVQSEAEDHHPPEEHQRQLTQPIHHPPEQEAPTAADFNNDLHESHFPAAEPTEEAGLPRKTSIQATFTFTTEQRCFAFLQRVGSKGRNENPQHPMTCKSAFDGILCWRPADPGETLLQACPEGPTNLKIYAKRECVNGEWRVYEHADDRLRHHSAEITHTDYAECLRIPRFAKKHAHQPTSAELRGPGEGVDVYRFQDPRPSDSQPHYAQPRPDNSVHATTASMLYDGQAPTLPPRPWEIKDIRDCDEFLRVHKLDDTRGGTWCSGGGDGHLCWPATAPGHEVQQPCPGTTGGSLVVRHCGSNGQWNQTNSDGIIPDNSDDKLGYINYEACQKPGSASAPVSVVLAGVPLQWSSNATGSEAGARHDENHKTEEATTITTVAATMAQTSGAGDSGVPRPLIASDAALCEKLQKDSSQWDEKPGGSCRGGSDGTVCWPTTKKNEKVSFGCPNMFGLDQSKTVTRHCGADGKWTKPAGSYVDCFQKELANLIQHDYHLHHAEKAGASSLKMLPSILVSYIAFSYFL